jgi:hypothetical protein
VADLKSIPEKPIRHGRWRSQFRHLLGSSIDLPRSPREAPGWLAGAECRAVRPRLPRPIDIGFENALQSLGNPRSSFVNFALRTVTDAAFRAAMSGDLVVRCCSYASRAAGRAVPCPARQRVCSAVASIPRSPSERLERRKIGIALEPVQPREAGDARRGCRTR